ncbi:MAG TPA: hypothetical protein VIK99_00330 [Thermaerobacter sp.]
MVEATANDGMRRFQEALRRPLTAGEIILEFVALVGLGLNAGLAAYYGPRLAGRIPEHFDPSGRPDGFGGAGILWEGLLVSLLLYGLLTLVPRLPAHWLNLPGRITVENAARVAGTVRLSLRVLKIFLVWMFTYVAWRSIAVARGVAAGLGPWFFVVAIVVGDLLLVVCIGLIGRAART